MRRLMEEGCLVACDEQTTGSRFAAGRRVDHRRRPISDHPSGLHPQVPVPVFNRHFVLEPVLRHPLTQ